MDGNELKHQETLAKVGIHPRELLYAERQMVKRGQLVEVAERQQKRFKTQIWLNISIGLLNIPQFLLMASAGDEGNLPLGIGMRILLPVLFLVMTAESIVQYRRMSAARKQLAALEES